MKPYFVLLWFLLSDSLTIIGTNISFRRLKPYLKEVASIPGISPDNVAKAAFNQVCAKKSRKTTISNQRIEFLTDFWNEFGSIKDITVFSSNLSLGSKILRSFSKVGLKMTLQNISEIRNLKFASKSGFVLLSCNPESINSLKWAEIHNAMSLSNVWLIHCNKMDEKLLNSLQLRINSQIYTFETWSSFTKIYEVYRVSDMKPMIAKQVGIWLPENGFTMTEQYIWERRKDLQGVNLVGGISNTFPPFIILDESLFNGQLKASGFIMDIWHQLERNCNFSTTLVQTPDSSWGSKQEDGKFNGVVGMVQRSEVDFGLGSIYLTEERAAAADHLNLVAPLSNSLYIKTSGFKDGSEIFLKPLRKDTMLVCVLFILLLALSLYGITRACQKLSMDEITLPLGLCLFFTINGMFGQGNPHVPIRYSSGVVFLASYFYGMIVVASYSAILTSLLAVQKESLPFVDDQTLLGNRDYKLLLLQDSNFVDLMKSGTDLRRRIYEEKTIEAPSLEEALETFDREPNLAFYWDKITLFDFAKKTGQSVTAIPGYTFSLPQTIYHKKNSSFKDLLDYQLSRMLQSGQIYKLEQKWYPKKPKSEEDSFSKPQDITTLYTIFLFIFAANFLGIALFLLEHLVKRMQVLK